MREGPVCVLLGPRQSGKTTLACAIAARSKDSHLFDLESASDRTRLADPELVLGGLAGLVVLDEVQRLPSLFETLRPLVDRPRSRTRFLLLGSASPGLVRGVSESLAGRASFVHLSGFDIGEVGSERLRRVWLRGGFPRSFLAPSDSASMRWRDAFLQTFLERDIPGLGIRIPPETLRRFWMMVAHSHGQVWNGADPARSLGVSEHTVRHYLDVLAGAYVVRVLPPWFENLAKRQYKAPKVYIRDSGLLHALLGLGSMPEVESHPKYGASWEGFALEQVLALCGDRDAFFWGTHAGAELDLLLLRRGGRFGVEFKCAGAPAMTKSLHVAVSDLGLDRAFIVHPGPHRYAVHRKVEAIPLAQAPQALARLAR